LRTEAELVVGDVLKPDQLSVAIADSTVLICATGARPDFNPTGPYQVDFEGTRNLVNLAKEKNLDQFILVSSLCVSRFFHPLNLFWLVLFWKKQAEEYLQKSGLPYTIVRPGGLKSTDDTSAIEVCVEALFQPSARNRIIEIVSRADAPPRSLPELFANLAPETGAAR